MKSVGRAAPTGRGRSVAEAHRVRRRRGVELVERRVEDEESGDTLHHAAEVLHLVERKLTATGALGVAVAEPFLEDRVAAELVAPDAVGDVPEEDLVV